MPTKKKLQIQKIDYRSRPEVKKAIAKQEKQNIRSRQQTKNFMKYRASRKEQQISLAVFIK